jgi:hypothetical protein
MWWLGGQIGLSTYNHLLASSPAGTMFSASLALGAKSGLASWPLFTGAVLLIAEWTTRRSAGEPAGEMAQPAGPAPWMPGPAGAGPGEAPAQ